MLFPKLRDPFQRHQKKGRSGTRKNAYQNTNENPFESDKGGFFNVHLGVSEVNVF